MGACERTCPDWELLVFCCRTRPVFASRIVRVRYQALYVLVYLYDRVAERSLYGLELLLTKHAAQNLEDMESEPGTTPPHT